jgi:hypothetical protein
MQVRLDAHTRQSIAFKVEFILNEDCLDEDDKLFFQLFTESTFDGSSAAARTMKQIAKGWPKRKQTFMLIHSMYLLIRSSNSEMLLWTNKLPPCVAPVH